MIDLFLIILGIVWLAAASYQDCKKREVPNWLNFSLIAVVLVYKALYSIFNSDLLFFVYGLMGLAIFVGLAYTFYYSRIFAGGDAKLMMGLGALIPYYHNFYDNLLLLLSFIFLLMICGGIYGLIYSVFLAVSNFNEFKFEATKQFLERKKLLLTCFCLGILLFVVVYFAGERIFYVLPFGIIILPLLFIYGKSVEECCMISQVSGKELTLGDWLYESIRIKGKTIKPNWEGLDEKELKLLKNLKKVKIKQGIPFVPAFLIAFVVLVYFNFDITRFLLTFG